MKMLAFSTFLASCLSASLAIGATEYSPVEAPGPGGPLGGTLLTASAADKSIAPVVLIIPGSGPTDRDGNSPGGVSAAPLRLLAEGLAQEGVSSLRIDKRGMFGSARAIPDPNKVTIEEYAGDVVSWIAVLRKRTGAPCVWVLGHSEGGLVALKSASQHAEGICGLVLVATAGRPVGAVIREQLQANPANAPLLAEANGAIDKLERGEHVDASDLSAPLRGLFPPAVQGFLISDMRQDPTALLASYPGPVLVVQGDNDIQVTVRDAHLLQQADARATILILPGVNHMLKRVEAKSLEANFASYGDPTLPLAPKVASSIADFVKTNSGLRQWRAD